jgi:hypothetical protein
MIDLLQVLEVSTLTIVVYLHVSHNTVKPVLRGHLWYKEKMTL